MLRVKYAAGTAAGIHCVVMQEGICKGSTAELIGNQGNEQHTQRLNTHKNFVGQQKKRTNRHAGAYNFEV
jgi:hypothetical protein